MTGRLALSRRAAARLLGIDRGATLDQLVRRGLLRPVPWGAGERIPLEQVEQLARTGFTLEGKGRRRLAARAKPGATDPAALRRLDVESLRRSP